MMSAVARRHRSGSALQFNGAAVGYGEKVVLRDVDLGLQHGEFLGVVGPNGSGKTTLIRAVTGHARVLQGRVLIEGEDAASLGARSLAATVGVLAQEAPEPTPFPGREYVAMGRHPHLGRLGRMTDEDWRVVDEAMRLTDTVALSLTAVEELSGGDLQRLTFAQTLAQEPRILLLDEPVSHLDLAHRLQVLDLCRDLADEGMAVLGVFHDLDLAARYADSIAVVAQGGIRAVGTPDDILRPAMLQEVFGVRAVVTRHPATRALTVTPLLRDDEIRARSMKRVMVVAGSGSSAWLLGEMARVGVETCLAALSRDDTDYAVAKALGMGVVELPPFGAVDEDVEALVLEQATQADLIVVARTPFGQANIGNLRAAVGSGVPIAFIGDMAGRDFASGAACELYEEAVRKGARTYPDDKAFLADAGRWLV
ncbi:MAG: heme ABC transporter ATP-binding protein [Coriobacteriia bacterium]